MILDAPLAPVRSDRNSSSREKSALTAVESDSASAGKSPALDRSATCNTSEGQATFASVLAFRASHSGNPTRSPQSLPASQPVTKATYSGCSGRWKYSRAVRSAAHFSRSVIRAAVSWRTRSASVILPPWPGGLPSPPPNMGVIFARVTDTFRNRCAAPRSRRPDAFRDVDGFRPLSASPPFPRPRVRRWHVRGSAPGAPGCAGPRRFRRPRGPPSRSPRADSRPAPPHGAARGWPLWVR
ncbi:hypothetical protein Strvi_6902 [Streptomyces violaceusniger Tu 4113]|uniref:Uncharacterized protein n=1 Tax=Streptomyces violaceusniger (strain Tu 4113) TaxID=653045 RepID=G2P0R0_STRV4|nr:hypothetical protein Strvi_6902 [Streptomyces violaceusniger Tu 4113]